MKILRGHEVIASGQVPPWGRRDPRKPDADRRGSQKSREESPLAKNLVSEALQPPNSGEFMYIRCCQACP